MPYQIFLFLFGAAIGSFLNVLASRYEDGGKIFRRDILTGRSHCPYCGETLRWYELIPLVSFLLQLGRCRHCGKGLSWQYPIVEILGGLIVLGAAAYLPVAPIWALVFLTLLLMTLIDLRLYVIPDQLNLFLAILAAGLLLSDLSVGNLLNHAIGAAVGAGFFAAVIVIYRITGALKLRTQSKDADFQDGIGQGDVKLAAALGLLFGWPKVLVLVGVAPVIGSIIGVGILLVGRKGMKDPIPFGPFLAVASVLVMIFGDVIINFYRLYL